MVRLWKYRADADQGGEMAPNHTEDAPSITVLTGHHAPGGSLRVCILPWTVAGFQRLPGHRGPLPNAQNPL